MSHLQSILMGISNFFLCYFTCWLFFSKRLKFLEEAYIEVKTEGLRLQALSQVQAEINKKVARDICCKCDRKIQPGCSVWPCKCGYQCANCENKDRGY